MLLQIGLLVSFVTREFFKEFVKMLSLFCVVLMKPKQTTHFLRQLFTTPQPELQLILYFIMLKKSTQVKACPYLYWTILTTFTTQIYVPVLLMGTNFYRSNFLVLFIVLLKSSQNKKGQKNFQVHSFRCLFLQLAAEKKTPKTVHLEFFFGPSYLEAALSIFFFTNWYPCQI